MVPTTRLEDLREIQDRIGVDPKDVPPETRKAFWRLVRQIKREPEPDISEVKLAAEIRNVLFNLDRSGVYSIGPFLGAQTAGAIVAFVVYYYGLSTPVSWVDVLSWSWIEIVAVVLRFLGLFFIVALLYPYGRVLAGSALGIHLDGMCFDEYKEPTIKIDYETFLLTSPPRRKWFFFFSGLWTLILSVSVGVLGFALAGDILGIAFGIFLAIFYACVISTGATAHSRGEMAHYNRERKIEQSWRRRIEKAS